MSQSVAALSQPMTMSRFDSDKEQRETVGANITRAREALGLTQRELAIKVGVGRTQITNWEGGRFMPRSHNLRALAEALQQTVGWFYDPPHRDRTA